MGYYTLSDIELLEIKGDYENITLDFPIFKRLREIRFSTPKNFAPNFHSLWGCPHIWSIYIYTPEISEQLAVLLYSLPPLINVSLYIKSHICPPALLKYNYSCLITLSSNITHIPFTFLQRNRVFSLFSAKLRTLHGMTAEYFITKYREYFSYRLNLCPKGRKLFDKFEHKYSPHKEDLSNYRHLLNTVVEFYSKSPQELCEQYVHDSDSLTPAELERMVYEIVPDDLAYLQNHLQPNDPHLLLAQDIARVWEVDPIAYWAQSPRNFTREDTFDRSYGEIYRVFYVENNRVTGFYFNGRHNYEYERWELSPAIWNLTALRKLVIYDCPLYTLPLEFARLTKLNNLTITNCQLTHIPTDLRKLTSLRYLKLSHNQLSEIPDFISQMTSLKFIYLEGNKISEFPQFVPRNPNLKWISLEENPIVEKIPPFWEDHWQRDQYFSRAVNWNAQLLMNKIRNSLELKDIDIHNHYLLQQFPLILDWCRAEGITPETNPSLRNLLDTLSETYSVSVSSDLKILL